MGYREDLVVTQERRSVVKKKKSLSAVYRQWYELLLDGVKADKKNSYIIELGAGAGFMKEFYPKLICADILPLDYIDLTCDCLALPLKDKTVQRFVMIDVFHHIACPEGFLREMQRCLLPSGYIVMIEPANSLWGRFIWKNFHHENFIPEKADWKVEGDGPLNCANGAMPWIVFNRDKKIFLQKFPCLEIEQYYTHTAFSYLLSGGFTCPQLIPDMFIKPLFLLDVLLCRLCGHLGMFLFIKLKKRCEERS